MVNRWFAISGCASARGRFRARLEMDVTFGFLMNDFFFVRYKQFNRRLSICIYLVKRGKDLAGLCFGPLRYIKSEVPRLCTYSL